MSRSVLVIGGSGGIGNAIATKYAEHAAVVSVISRQAAPKVNNWHWYVDSAQDNKLSEDCVQQALQHQPELIFICNGVLHDSAAMPEKTLRQLDSTVLMQRFYANVAVPAHYLRLLLGYITKTAGIKVIVLSAKVGSISDNALGGWYSYRMSKAALNMLVKNVSIEVGRLNKTAAVVSVHPGTTDTAMSAPFQTNLPAGQLQSTASTAQRLVQVATSLQPELTGKLLNWDGTVLPF